MKANQRNRPKIYSVNFNQYFLLHLTRRFIMAVTYQTMTVIYHKVVFV